MGRGTVAAQSSDTDAADRLATAPRGVEPLRILQVNSLLNGGGADNQTLELCAGLQELRQDVTLAVAAGCRWERLARGIPGVRVVTLPLKQGRPIGVTRRLTAIIRERNIQIVHAHQGRDYWPAILAARLAGRRTRVAITRHLIKRPKTASRWLLLRVADVVAVSRAVEGVLRRDLHGPKSKLHLVYGGIDTERFKPANPLARRELRERAGWSDGQVVFAVVGAFDLPRGKGQAEFLEAASRVRAAHPDARFAIIGSGSMEGALRERIQALALSDAATMIPFTDDVAPVMSALDVVVHPALGTEALGLVLWEAMACGTPVIASRLDGIPEAFVDGVHGVLVPPDDVAALAAAMTTMLDRPDLRRAYGEAGRQHVVSRFSRSDLAHRILELYAGMCSRR